MALIPCPFCGNNVSDKAIRCPHCKQSLQRNETASGGAKQPSDTSASGKKKFPAWIIAVIALSALAVAIIVALLVSINNDNDYDSYDYDSPACEEPTWEEIIAEPDNRGDYSPALFSVSPYQTVQFSPGNLQYCPSDDIWRFAPEQYYIVGYANGNVSSNYDGWIDLFGWGTGNTPTKSSKDAAEYTSFKDWGDVAGLGSEWRTLNMSELHYLFVQRDDASYKYGFAKVCGVAGVIILPDTWTLPNTCSFNSSNYASSYSSNTYNNSQWSDMEAAGAVFLPAAGRRDGKEMFHVGTDGDYWTSSPYQQTRAFNLDFNDGNLYSDDNSLRKHAFAVRLVKNW